MRLDFMRCKNQFRVTMTFFLVLFCQTALSWADSPSLQEELLRSQKEQRELDDSLSRYERRIIAHSRPSERMNLESSLRPAFDRHWKLERDIARFEKSLQLKEEILRLPAAAEIPGDRHASLTTTEREVDREAEAMARVILVGFDEIKEKFEMLRPAIFQNILVNMKIKEEGFCWHWTREFTKRLKSLDLHQYEIHWATAREATQREHNTVVLTRWGQSLPQGLVIDGWRKSGKPFWIRVDQDHYPWKEGKNYSEE